MTETEVSDKRAPMASAPMKYMPDGSVDWGNMWDSFCVLAKDGGPPHRPTRLMAPARADTASESYKVACAEIIRGIEAVSTLRAEQGPPGWIAVRCQSAAQAKWLQEAVEQENVQARYEGAQLFVPAGEGFTLKGEIKNVITAVAKTTHYWKEHVPADIRVALNMEWRVSQVKARFRGLFARNA